ncbi:ribonuclease H-like domain-containing protein [Tanacetum coccineum]
MYENFSVPSTESLDSIFNMLQKIVSQLAILGENISQEDLNLKFLRSLSSEWNKPDLDTMSFDDLYNNFKIVEQEVKGTASSSSSSSYQNMDFVSSPNSTNEVNTAYGVSTTNTQVSPASTQVSTASTQVSTANLSDDTVYAFLASQPNGSQIIYEDLEQIHEDDIEKMDLKWQLALLSMRTRRGSRNQDSRNRNQDSSRRTVNVEETSSKAMVAIDGATLRIELNKSEFNLDTYKRGLASVEEQLVFYKKNEFEKLKQEKENNQLKIENFDNASKSLDKLIGSQIIDKSRKGVGFVSYNVVPPSSTGLFSPPNLDLSYSGLEEFQQLEFEGYGPQISKSVSEDISNEVRESSDVLLVEELVSYDKLKKKTNFPTVAKIDFVKAKQQEKPVRKPIKYAEMYRLTAITIKGKRNMVPRAVLMKTGLRSLNTARLVNTAHPKTTVYSARPMSYFSKLAQSTGHPQKEDQGYVDSGCSRHMTGNMSYLSDFKEFNGGYELQFNLFSVSQMCDKKNSVHNESQVLLKVPRKNNMYSVDMKNIVPKECLTCLVAKATLDESMLWHRRLGHVNFKTINKLVKENLVRGLPSKRFENDQTCVACLKGKQHKASYLLRIMSEFYEEKGIKKEFSTAKTPQQNGIAERRNRILIEAARTMLDDSKLPTIFWAEAVNTACYV